jgi:trypsin
MRRSRPLFWSVGLWLTLAVAPDSAAIVNGVPVSDEIFAQRFGWAVALVAPSSGICTAQLISPTWVLTAAHCASPRHRLLVGHASRGAARQVGIASVIRHPRYDAATAEYDVALIRLAEHVNLDPLRIATSAEAQRLLRPDARAIIVGWGRRSAKSDFADRLVESDVELGQLQRRGARFIYVDRVSGPCGGDSGGPLLMESEEGVSVLLGVASQSGGDICAAGGGIGVYVDVAAIRDFIEQHVKDLPQ